MLVLLCFSRNVHIFQPKVGCIPQVGQVQSSLSRHQSRLSSPLRPKLLLRKPAASPVKRVCRAERPHVRALRDAFLPFVCDARRRDELLRLRPEVTHSRAAERKRGAVKRERS